MKSKTCKKEGCNNSVWSKGMCKYHIPPSMLKSKGFKKKYKKRTEEEIEEGIKMKEFFMKIWNSRSHYSEVSNTWLGPEPLTLFFHHIMPKKKYENLKFEEENIVLLTWDEHTSVEANPYKYEIVNLKREQLKTKFNIL